MNIPYTKEQFLQNLHFYNESIWPVQVVWLAIGLTLVVLACLKPGLNSKTLLPILAAMWLWNGAVFHLGYHSLINPAGLVFGLVFILQAMLFWGANRNSEATAKLGFEGWSAVGTLLVAYAVLGYPLVGTLAGHFYPDAPVLGVAPCPTVIFTIGLMLLCAPRLPRWLFVIPILWSALGWSMVRYGIWEDLGLAFAGLAALSFVLTARKARVTSGSTGLFTHPQGAR